jgi:FMN-dependent NADH-azoreductase
MCLGDANLRSCDMGTVTYFGQVTIFDRSARMKLLHIDTSISGGGSASRQLSTAIVAAFRRAMPGLEVIRRDLDDEPIPHLDSRRLPTVRPANAPEGATGVPDPEGASALDEFLAADLVVIGAPMYNFTVPSQLKAWIDRILIAGKTFHYSETGPVGLAGGKRVIIASSRGGLYTAGTPFETNDFQEKYLRAVFAFIGIENVEILRAEGLALGPEQREAAIRAALASVPAAVTRFAPREAA